MYLKAWQRRDVEWKLATPMEKNTTPKALRRWLYDVGSLTRQLRMYCHKDFSVRLISQTWETPLPSEAKALNIPQGHYAFVRQVHLLCGGHARVYARTIIPVPVAMGRLRGLTHLGTRPLGEVLFSNRTMQRGPIEVAKIASCRELNRLAHGAAGDSTGTIWGRRSVFHLYNLPLLVSEIFLSDFPA
ncbi:MAG: chorismate lyase [Gammaproteobacteria bacterium]|nr:chorismate lyase [Gammaproteobacteria bacterium]